MGPLFYIILLAILLGIAALLLIPVSLRFDSTQRSLHVGWMGLSFTKSLARKRLKPAKEVPVIRKETKKPKEKPEETKKGRISVAGKLLLKERELMIELLQRGYRSILDLFRSFSIREMEASVSTPDPMWNGVLAGIFASVSLEDVKLSANFQNINYVRGWLLFRPYRVAIAAAGLFIRLPYRHIIKTLLSIKKSTKRRNHHRKRA